MSSVSGAKGADTLVLLIHGLSGSSQEMQPLAKFLEQHGYTCLTPMLLGHGTTIEDLKTVRLEQWLGQLHQIVESPPKKQLILCGLSFGSLLALELALKYPAQCRALIMLSPPWKLRSSLSEVLLSILSFLPEKVLDMLPSISKANRPLSLREGAYKRHCIGSAVRVAKLRKALLPSLWRLNIPTLTIFDSSDHHLNAAAFLRPEINTPNTIDLRGGAHELTLGPRAEELFSLIYQFLSQHKLCPEN